MNTINSLNSIKLLAFLKAFSLCLILKLHVVKHESSCSALQCKCRAIYFIDDTNLYLLMAWTTHFS